MKSKKLHPFALNAAVTGRNSVKQRCFRAPEHANSHAVDSFPHDFACRLSVRPTISHISRAVPCDPSPVLATDRARTRTSLERRIIFVRMAAIPSHNLRSRSRASALARIRDGTRTVPPAICTSPAHRPDRRSGDERRAASAPRFQNQATPRARQPRDWSRPRN